MKLQSTKTAILSILLIGGIGVHTLTSCSGSDETPDLPPPPDTKTNSKASCIQ